MDYIIIIEDGSVRPYSYREHGKVVKFSDSFRAENMVAALREVRANKDKVFRVMYTGGK